MTVDVRPDRPVTFGQLSVWRIMERHPVARWPESYLRATVPVPAGTTMERVSAGLAVLCERHESLRTHFVAGPEGPSQRVMPVTDPEPEHVERPGAGADDALAVANELARTPINRATEFGRRFAVITDGGRPAHVALIVDHIVADGFGLQRLGAELAAAMGGDHADGRWWLAQTPPQPWDLAVEQRSEAAQPRRTAALERWRHLLRTLPPQLFPVPLSVGETPGRIEAILHSPRARANLALVSAKTGISPATVLLALTVVATGTVTRSSTDVVLTLQSSNRFAPPWRSVVSSMNQYTPLPLTLGPPTAPFTHFAASVHTAAFRAYRTGCYDLDAVTELVRAERGTGPGFDHFFNFMAHQVSAADAPAESAAPGWVEETIPQRQIGPRFDVKIREGADMPVVIRVDPTLLTRDELHALALWFDEQLHRLATGADSTVSDVLATCAQATGR